jgi:hypothetical protein
MSQPPAPGHGLGDEPVPGSRLPGGGALVPEASLRLTDFAGGGAGDACLPGPGLAVALAALSGPDWRCAGASDDELIGLLGRWAALEAWAAAGKLGVARELIRRRAGHGRIPSPVIPDELPRSWHEGTGHEAAAALGLSLTAADKLLDLAWTLRARLPAIGAKLADGTIDVVKATIIVKELAALDDEHATRAEALILADLAGKTAGQVGKLAAQAAATVDPEGSVKRRERAEREDARVRFWRENTGACTLAGYGLPTDAALAANANIGARARQYKKAKVSPDATMDQLRVLAFCDILNGVTADARIARARADQAQAENPAEDHDDGRAGDDGPGDELAASVNLTIPLTTLLGQEQRPGLGHGLGPIDPVLARDLAAAAAGSAHSTWCVTVTSADGIAIGHGCARPSRRPEQARKRKRNPGGRGRHGPLGRSRDPTPAFTQRDDPGPPGGYGTWTLTLPGGQELDVRLLPIPVTDCDHRYESHGYQPSDLLRHLVQVRDGVCTFPCCSRHARESDFEHAIPYEKGGRTCACNAGARSRRCHKVKQSNGWSVTQSRPGWHQWTTPSGRTYTQGPMRYPV